MRFLNLTKNLPATIFFITIFSCFLINSGNLNSEDALGRLNATHWLWMNVPQVPPPQLDITGVDGKQFAHWGIGQSLLMLPADILSWPIVEHLPPGGVREELIGYLTFPLFDACTVLLAYYLLLELRFARTAAALGALGLFFGTSFLPYAQFQEENTLMFFSLIGGLLGCLIWLRTDKIWPLCLGAFSLGWGLLVRLPCVLDAFFVVFYTLISIWAGQNARRDKMQKSVRLVVMFGVFYAPFIAADRFYQWIRFGSFTSTYYGIQAAQARALDPTLPASYPFSTPFFEGFTGFLFAPDKSIFIFNPLLILATWLCIRYRKILPAGFGSLLGVLWLLLMAQICFYARATFWRGDTAWGPRYVVTECMAISLLAIPAFVRAHPLMKSRVEKLVGEALIAVSCFIQMIAVLFNENLERSQEITFHVTYFIVWQRLVNTAAILTGSFQNSALDPGLKGGSAEPWTSLDFMPWRTAGEFPRFVTHGLELAWVMGLLFLIGILVVFLAQLRGGSVSGESEIS